MYMTDLERGGLNDEVFHQHVQMKFLKKNENVFFHFKNENS